MTATQDIRQIMTDPALYPFQVNWLDEQIYFLRTTPSFYGDAAFLDQRAIAPGTSGDWVDLAQIKAKAIADPVERLGIIFHIGHCGSTLISRTLGLADGFFCLREPLPLRELASFWSERHNPWAQKCEDDILTDMDMMRALWMRTPKKKQTSVVKTTSFCSLLATTWLSRFRQDRALCLAMAPETYITTVLGADAYVYDLIGGAKPRMATLMEITGVKLSPLHTLSPGEVAAMTYTAEMVSMQRAADTAGDRVLRVDFDRYLKASDVTLREIASHLGRPVDPASVNRILANPILGRYSKATNYSFSSGERQERLKASRTQNKDEIAKGMAWLIDFARANPIFADALRAFGYAN